MSVRVGVVLHPLQEFEIILTFALGEFLHLDVLGDVELRECFLQYFKVLDVLILQRRFEIHFLERNLPRMRCIEDLAVGSAVAHLLDLGVGSFELQKIIDPC